MNVLAGALGPDIDAPSADALAKCAQEVGSLLVSLVDRTGVIGRSLLKALEDFVTCLSPMPDLQHIGRYAPIGMLPLPQHPAGMVGDASAVLCLCLHMVTHSSSSIWVLKVADTWRGDHLPGRSTIPRYLQ